MKKSTPKKKAESIKESLPGKVKGTGIGKGFQPPKVNGFDPYVCPNCAGNHVDGTAHATPECIRAMAAARRTAGLPMQQEADKPQTPKKVAIPGPIDFAADSPGEAKGDKLEQVMKLARQIKDYEQDIEQMQQRLTEKQAVLLTLQQVTLPELMASLQVSEFKLDTGEKVYLKEFMTASLPSESQIEGEKDDDKRLALVQRRKDGLAFLNKEGAGAIIKTYLSAELGKDAKKLAEEAEKALAKLGIGARTSVSVHAATLKAWCNERIKAGKKVDEKAFGIFSGKKAVLEMPKEKKTK